jgi:phage terminase large subunit-like protein
VLYEFPREMIESKTYRLPENFRITNPNLGASVDVEFLEREALKATAAGPESEVGFFSKHLNIEIGLALISDRWAGAEFWQAQEQPITLETILARCDVVDVGIDGGGLDDLLGLAVIGRDRASGQWLLWAHAWGHPKVFDRHEQQAGRFRDFAVQGDLTLVDRIGEDVQALAAIVARIEAAGLLDKVGVDPYGVGGVLDALMQAGIDKDKVIGISQGWKLGGAIKTTERRLAEGELLVFASEMMRWCVGNARVEPKGNSILITKQASGSAKIDPLMAGFDAVQLMQMNPPAHTYQAFVI